MNLGPLRLEEPVKVSFFDCYARTIEYGSAYVLSLSLLGLSPQTMLAAFDLTSPQFDLCVDFPEDPQLTVSKEQVYRLADRTTFHRSQVLNHRIGRNGTLRRGCQFDGVLIAQAFAPIPECYEPGSSMPAVLSIADAFGEATEWPLELRIQQPYHRQPVSRSTRKGLFDESVRSSGIRETPEESSSEISSLSAEFDDRKGHESEART